MTRLQLARLGESIDWLNSRIGRGVAWLVLVMALVQFAIILMRGLAGVTSLWLQESLIYFHVALVLFAAAWTLRNEGHVRIDIFYGDASPRTQALVDLVGAIVLLLPFMIAIVWFALPYVLRSWALHESSREAGGLPLLFLLKSAILVFAAQMLLQGLSQAIRAGLVLNGRNESPVAADR